MERSLSGLHQTMYSRCQAFKQFHSKLEFLTDFYSKKFTGSQYTHTPLFNRHLTQCHRLDGIETLDLTTSCESPRTHLVHVPGVSVPPRSYLISSKSPSSTFSPVNFFLASTWPLVLPVQSKFRTGSATC